MKKRNNGKKTKKINKNDHFKKLLVILFGLLIFVFFSILIDFFQFQSYKNISKTSKNNFLIERRVFKTFKNNLVREYKFFLNGKEIGRQYFRKDGSLSRTRGIIPDGIVREYYPNKNIKAEAEYNNKNLHGIEYYYYENGPLMAKFYYDKGRIFPKADVYYENGAIYSRWRYNQADNNGLAFFYYNNGKLAIQARCNSGQEFINLLGFIKIDD